MEVQTNSGIVFGKQEKNIYAFLGIPYAKAQRFQPPHTYQWDGTLDCTEYGKMSMQSWEGPLISRVFPREKLSEDSLNLNIFTLLSLKSNLWWYIFTVVLFMKAVTKCEMGLKW